MHSISKWGMFPIAIPEYKEEYEGLNHNCSLQQTLEQDVVWKVALMMKKMKAFKESVAAYANRLG